MPKFEQMGMEGNEAEAWKPRSLDENRFVEPLMGGELGNVEKFWAQYHAEHPGNEGSEMAGASDDAGSEIDPSLEGLTVQYFVVRGGRCLVRFTGEDTSKIPAKLNNQIFSDMADAKKWLRSQFSRPEKKGEAV